MTPYLNDLGLICALGDRGEILTRLFAGDRSGLTASDQFSPGRLVRLGHIDAELPAIPCEYGVYDCRNNRLLLAALAQIEASVAATINRYGADRVGVVLGTSTSGVASTDDALAYQARCGRLPDGFHYKQQQMGAGADFLAAYLGVTGPAYTLSSACSSSGKAFGSARRLLRLGLCDAVIVGGADSLCKLTVNGFAALESLSAGYCKPFGRNRDGINLGEAASLFVLSKEPGPVALLGVGATSDAYHFSSPDPEGVAVIEALRGALDDAGLTAADVDYLNLHGTGTVLNDAMESVAINAVFGARTPASSSKGMTGHALGAAAALELGLCWLLLTANPAGALIPNVNGDAPDPKLAPLNLVPPGAVSARGIRVCQSNAFAFGGSNVSIVIART